MSMPTILTVVAISREQRLVMLGDGSVLPVTNWLDADGDETEDASEAVAYVAGTERCGWISGSLSAFEMPTRN